MNVTPYINASEAKKKQVEKMFNQIAFRYDLLNQLLSFGIHTRWRKKAISFIAKNSPQVFLDVATGTADFALEASVLHPKKIIGIDIAEEMLVIGRKKIEEKRLSHLIELIQADSENIPFPENYFDAVTVGFGVRNFENLEKGLSEICRTLKKKGTLCVLEFSIPENFPMKQLYNFYLKNICPLLGRMISKDPFAYTYLFKSVKGFPYGQNFKNILLNTGFSEVELYTQTFGVVTIYLAKK